MRRIGAGLAVLLVIGGIVALAAVLLRPSTTATSTVDPDVTLECAGATGLGETSCREWGDEILVEGAPTTTFEAEDVVRLRLDRALFGFGDECRAEWFLGRYPADAAWSEAVGCAER